MRKVFGLWMMAAAVWATAAGCGDNNRTCGDGTTDMNGTCVPTDQCGPGTTKDPMSGQCVPDGSIICTDGTKFDPATGKCVIDPNSCQDGTVLINGACVDPTKGLTVDIEEAPEPNGLGVIESSQAPAGTIALKPVGSADGFIIHGTIAPFQDSDGDGQMDPDVDSYILNVNAPALIHISADGVHGIDAAFVGLAAVQQNDPLANYVRFGMNITGDTSARQLYLPAAGTYVISIADARTLYQYSTGGPVNAAPGPGDYYITIDSLAIPAATAITPSAGVGTQDGTIAADSQVEFFTMPMGTGFNDVLLTTSAPQITGSVLVSNNNVFRGLGTAGTDPFTGAPTPAEVLVGGINAADSPVIAVDSVYDTAVEPVPFTLTVTSNDAAALPTDGTTVSQPEISNAPQAISDFNLFYYDVTAADETDGMKIHFNHPVDGLIVTQDLFIFSPFSFDPNNGFVGNTFQDYAGLLRHPQPGRYYFLVYDPNSANAGGNLIATSTWGALTPTPITEGTATADTQVGPYNSNPFTYDKGADPWQQFASTTSNAGTVTVSFYDPTTAYGRLDNVAVNGAATPADVAPVFEPALPASGAAKGRIMLDDQQLSFYVKANAANAAATNSYALTFSARPFVDFGTIALGDAQVDKTNNTLAAGGTVFFLAQTDNAANLMQFVGTPTGTPKPGISIHNLNNDESVALSVNGSATGGAATAVLPVHANKWVAVSVTGLTAVAAGTFDMSAVATAEGTYAQSTPAATFTSICSPATTVTMHDDGSGFGSNDEGLSNPINTPAGFKFFGASVGQIQISTNGWASFQTNQPTAAFSNADMPTAGAPDAVIAPYWTDLAGVQVCEATVAGSMTIEWRGFTFGSGANVAVQAILNGSTGTITFVYDAAGSMDDDGSDATVGVEDFSGGAASKIEYKTAASIAAGDVFRFTPM